MGFVSNDQEKVQELAGVVNNIKELDALSAPSSCFGPAGPECLL